MSAKSNSGRSKKVLKTTPPAGIKLSKTTNAGLFLVRSSLVTSWNCLRTHHAFIATLIQIVMLFLILWQLIQLAKSPDLHLEFSYSRTAHTLNATIINHENVVAELPQVDGFMYLMQFPDADLYFEPIERKKPFPEFVRPSSWQGPIVIEDIWSAANNRMFLHCFVTCKTCPDRRSHLVVFDDTSWVVRYEVIEKRFSLDSLLADPDRYLPLITKDERTPIAIVR